jgi:ribosomal protein S18 acetylase RimI-like enzyme
VERLRPGITDVESLPQGLTIRPATPADAAALAAFGARTFRETFEPDNRADDVAAYVDAAYSVARQRTEIAHLGWTTLMAESSTDLVAFAQTREGDAPDEVSGPAPIELLRFYVDRDWHGRGVAHPLMAAVFAAARARGARTLWLGVWERNARAIAFYHKQGFRDVGSHEFVLGTDHQIDRLMARRL